MEKEKVTIVRPCGVIHCNIDENTQNTLVYKQKNNEKSNAIMNIFGSENNSKRMMLTALPKGIEVKGKTGLLQA